MLAYWWNAQTNFGDQLTPYMLRHYLGLQARWAPPEVARLVMVGSVIDVLPTRWIGVIAGAGKLHEDARVPRYAEVIGLRGLLTAENVRGDFAIGDPGLLMDELVPRGEQTHNLGVVHHWTDHRAQTLGKRFAHLDPYIIDPRGDPADVAYEISTCKKIVASSLHAIILADAYGIPRRAEEFPALRTRREGGTFKFRDYSTAIDLPMEFGVLQTAPRKAVDRAQAELFDMVRRLGPILDD